MNEQKKELSFSAAEIQAVLGSQEGKRLLELLNRDGGAALRSAAQSVRNGDMAAAKAAVAPLLQTGEAQSLMEKISGRAQRNG